MAYGADTMYKDPRVQGAASPVGAKRPGAPSRTRGMMGMAAQARAGAPREGAPPVPVTSAPPKKKKKDPRAEAARRMFGGAEFQPMGYGGQPEGGSQQPDQFGPAYQPGTTMETQGPAEPLTYGKPPITPIQPGLGPLTPMSDPWGMPPGEGDPTGTTPASDTPTPAPPPPAPLPGGPPGMPGKTPGMGFPAPGIPPGTNPKYATGDEPGAGPETAEGIQDPTDQPGSENWEAIEKWRKEKEHEAAMAAAKEEEYQKSLVYVEGYGMMDPDDAAEIEKLKAQKELDATHTQGEQEKDYIFDKFVELMSTQTGVSKEELASQMQGIQNASTEQMAQLAEQMAARGLSFSGQVGAGMANIAAATMQAMVDLQYEHSKLALQDKLERAKMFASMYGHTLSEENRLKLFEQMNQWEREQWESLNKQKADADRWTAVNDMAAQFQATGGWQTKALAWAFWASSTDGGNMSADEIISNLEVVNDKIDVVDSNWTGTGGGAAGAGGGAVGATGAVVGEGENVPPQTQLGPAHPGWPPKGMEGKTGKWEDLPPEAQMAMQNFFDQGGGQGTEPPGNTPQYQLETSYGTFQSVGHEEWKTLSPAKRAVLWRGYLMSAGFSEKHANAMVYGDWDVWFDENGNPMLPSKGDGYPQDYGYPEGY